MGKPVAINGYRMSAGGEGAFLKNGKKVEPQASFFSKSHFRAGKTPKLLIQVPMLNNNLSLNPYCILRDAEYLYAVDTNTREKPQNGECRAVSIALEYQVIKTVTEPGVQFITRYCLNHKSKNRQLTEKVGLIELIKLIQNSRIKDNPNGRILLITDHDAGNINKYNDKTMPLLSSPQFYLPENFKLIYASADGAKKNDSIYNKLIYECDCAATKELQKIK